MFYGLSHQKEYILRLWYFHVSLPDPHPISPNQLFHPSVSRAALAPECFLSILGSFTSWPSTLLSPIPHLMGNPYSVCTCWLFNCGTKQLIGFMNSQNKWFWLVWQAHILFLFLFLFLHSCSTLRCFVFCSEMKANTLFTLSLLPNQSVLVHVSLPEILIL